MKNCFMALVIIAAALSRQNVYGYDEPAESSSKQQDTGEAGYDRLSFDDRLTLKEQILFDARYILSAPAKMEGL